MIMQLYSCGGNKSVPEIPVTGETLTPTNTAESSVIPTMAQVSQSLPEATVLSQSTTPPEKPACQTPTATIESKIAQLRDGPDLRFITIAQYKTGDQFKVLGQYKDWFQVESIEGQKGWLYKEWLTIPSNIEITNICSILEQDLPVITQDSQKSRQDTDSQCVPTYYDTCD